MAKMMGAFLCFVILDLKGQIKLIECDDYRARVHLLNCCHILAHTITLPLASVFTYKEISTQAYKTF